MTASVIFEDRALGRIDALLGVVTVGSIVPLDHPRARVARQFLLSPAGLQPAADTDAAKRAIERCTRQWLEAAGLS